MLEKSLCKAGNLKMYAKPRGNLTNGYDKTKEKIVISYQI